MRGKKCHYCGQVVPRLWYSKPPTCSNYSCKKKYNEEKENKAGANSPKRENKYRQTFSKVGNKKPKPTGEFKLFMQIFAETKGVCRITGKQLKFDVSNFAHVLSKGSFAKYRLYKPNIIQMDPSIHHLYDSSSEEILLAKFPKAQLILDVKKTLKPLFIKNMDMTTAEKIKFCSIFGDKHDVKFTTFKDLDFDICEFKDGRSYHFMDILYDIGHDVPVGKIEEFHDNHQGSLGQNSFALWMKNIN